MSEEEYCLEVLARLRAEFESIAQPYIDRLIALKQMRADPIIVPLDPEIAAMLADREYGV